LSAAAAAVILRRTINATRPIYFLYQVLEIALFPGVALYLLYRGIRNRGYFTGLPERFGFQHSPVETTGAGSIWFHAVSVGEVLSLVQLLRRLRAEHPTTPLFVSTTTLAGRATARLKLAGLADAVFFAPLDYRSCVRRVLRRLRPSAVVVLETEIWPNLYRESKRAGASLVVVNGRISDRALPRYRRWSWFFRHVLSWPDTILVQTEEDARRYVIAGAAAGGVRVGGNLKYDFTPPEGGIGPEIARFLDDTHPVKIWIAASTTAPVSPRDADEDDAVIAAFGEISASEKGLLLIVAPRKPERFDVVAEKLESAGIRYVRRSALGELELPGVLLLDSIGELAALFARADAVFMGGTLAARGGHNILEPAYFGKPVVVGPHMENFAAIAEEFHGAGALKRIEEPGALKAAIQELLQNGDALGARARELARSKRGVTGRIAQEILNAYAEGVPNPAHPLAARVLLTPLTWLWRLGHQVNMWRSVAARRTLQTPVISIGGLTMGGAGKSPMAAHLAMRLREAGRNPAILTRGYKRKSAEPMVIVPRGGAASTDLTGDEAQMFVRAGDADVGIGRDRYETGRRMEETLKPGVFLLDDGFQHARLARKHDIVLVDALDPLGGGVFPLGRSREPAASLRRATAVVVTRVAPRQQITGLERLLRSYNPSAPIFHSSVVPQRWISVESSSREEPGFHRVAAFCGLGHPDSFWRTLEALKLEVVFRWAFGDHHSYRPVELERLAGQAAAAGAEALVTTEKDALNLMENAPSLVAPLKLYWLKIGIEIEKEEELLRLIL
jgi:3-deoxy-D-manno-octulosonic-acid transferase